MSTSFSNPRNRILSCLDEPLTLRSDDGNLHDWAEAIINIALWENGKSRGYFAVSEPHDSMVLDASPPSLEGASWTRKQSHSSSRYSIGQRLESSPALDTRSSNVSTSSA